MDHKEKARNFFSERYHCSQAVLAAFAEECGLSEQQALKLGACFGSGMRKGEVCGACTGALMVLGSLYGHCEKDDLESRQRAYWATDSLLERFAAKCGSYRCNELLTCDISTPEGLVQARQKHLFTEYCPKLVEEAVSLVEQIMAEE